MRRDTRRRRDSSTHHFFRSNFCSLGNSRLAPTQRQRCQDLLTAGAIGEVPLPVRRLRIAEGVLGIGGEDVGAGAVRPAELQGLLLPNEDVELVLQPVRRLVNDVRNDGPELIEPAPPEAILAEPILAPGLFD